MQHPSSVTSALGRAQHWLDVGQPDRALEALDGAVTTDHPGVLTTRAVAHLMAGRDEQAVAAASRALAHGPAAEPLAVIASAYSDSSPAKAEEALLGALRLAPDSPALLGQYAMLVGACGQFDKARGLIDRAQQLAPHDAELHVVRSRIAYLSGDDRTARRSAEAAMSVDPRSLRARLVLGALHVERGRAATGRALLGSAASDHPDQREIVAGARAARALAHPLAAPLRFVHRVGPARLWIGFMVVLLALEAAGQHVAAFIVAMTYLTLALYTWIARPILARRIERQR